LCHYHRLVTSSDWLTYDDFSGRVGESFDIAPGDGSSMLLELAEAVQGAEPGGPGPDGQQRLQFSLVFRGPLTPALPQRAYRLTHADLGELELFLVPIARDGDGMRYEAAFA
jgi:hypothetical protein